MYLCSGRPFGHEEGKYSSSNAEGTSAKEFVNQLSTGEGDKEECTKISRLPRFGLQTRRSISEKGFL